LADTSGVPSPHTERALMQEIRDARQRDAQRLRDAADRREAQKRMLREWEAVRAAFPRVDPQFIRDTRKKFRSKSENHAGAAQKNCGREIKRGQCLCDFVSSCFNVVTQEDTKSQRHCPVLFLYVAELN
jgi:hypothetical protein